MTKTRDIAALIDIIESDSDEGPCIACQLFDSLDWDQLDAANFKESFEALNIDLDNETLQLIGRIQIPLQKIE